MDIELGLGAKIGTELEVLSVQVAFAGPVFFTVSGSVLATPELRICTSPKSSGDGLATIAGVMATLTGTDTDSGPVRRLSCARLVPTGAEGRSLSSRF